MGIILINMRKGRLLRDLIGIGLLVSMSIAQEGELFPYSKTLGLSQTGGPNTHQHPTKFIIQDLTIYPLFKPRPNLYEDIARKKRAKRKGIMGMILSADISSIGWVESHYFAVGVRLFRLLDILAGTGKFGAFTWGGGVISYNYWMIGAKGRISLFSPSRLLSCRYIFFLQYGLEYGWSASHWRDEKGWAMSFGMGYESPIIFHSVSFNCLALIKGGNPPLCLTGALGIGLGTTWYFK